MSRIGRLPIAVPSNVEVKIDGQDVAVKGPKGELKFTVREPITIAKNEQGELQVSRPDDERLSRSLHGLTRTLVSNMVTGVTQGYEKKLEIVGVGYPCRREGPHPAGVRPRVLAPGGGQRPGGHHLHRRDSDQVHGARHRQAACR